MTKNIGDVDRVVRLLIGASSGFLFLVHHVPRWGGIVVPLIAAYLLLTSLTGRCPLYALFRISTRSPEDVQATND